MKTWYFTFGTDERYPFYRGWVEIVADSKKTACGIFRVLFPNRPGSGALNCAFVYDEEEWAKNKALYYTDPAEKCHMRFGPTPKEDLKYTMTKDRLFTILLNYIENDLESADPDYVRNAIMFACSRDEIKDLRLYEKLGLECEEDEKE